MIQYILPTDHLTAADSPEKKIWNA